MDETQFKEISDKLDTVVKLLVVTAVGDKAGREAIACLNKAGFQPKEIAGRVGTTPNTVRVALTAIRKNKRKGGKRKR